MKYRCVGLFSILTVFILNTPILSADETRMVSSRKLLDNAAFPENDETRRLLFDTFALSSHEDTEAPFMLNKQVSDGRLVQFELRNALTNLYYIFRNQRGNVPHESYPLWGRGTWIIKKDILSGSLLQAKVFLQDDELSFIRLFPRGNNRSSLDVHLYGRQLSDDVIIPLPFEELILAPVARIVSLTERTVNWEMIFPNPDSRGYRYVENMVNQLSRYQSAITELADGAINGAGLNVLIETGKLIGVGEPTGNGGTLESGKTGLNCSGYVKWVVDGLYSAWSGHSGARYLNIDELRQPSFRGNRNPWSDSRSAASDETRKKLELLLRDPYFGLDWNRNLARIVEEARLGRTLSDEEIALLDTGELAGVSYSRDRGYNLDDIQSVLFQLASLRPGAIYLAAFNSRFVPEPTALDPNPIPLHQYWHVSILAPWFSDGAMGDERGRFHATVLDVGDVAETLLSDSQTGAKSRFIETMKANATRYARLGRDKQGLTLVPEVMVHLTRIDVAPDFVPSPLAEAIP